MNKTILWRSNALCLKKNKVCFLLITLCLKSGIFEARKWPLTHIPGYKQMNFRVMILYVPLISVSWLQNNLFEPWSPKGGGGGLLWYEITFLSKRNNWPWFGWIQLSERPSHKTSPLFVWLRKSRYMLHHTDVTWIESFFIRMKRKVFQVSYFISLFFSSCLYQCYIYESFRFFHFQNCKRTINFLQFFRNRYSRLVFSNRLVW